MKQLPMRFLQRLDILFGKSVDPQALGIDQAHLVIAIDFAEGGHVMVDARGAAEVAEFTDGDQVMHPAGAHHVDVVAADDVAGEHAIVGEQAIVSHLHVVGEVRVDHEKIAVADAGHAAAFFRAEMNGDGFPENVVLTDFNAGGRSAEFTILRRTTDHGIWMKYIVRTNRGVADDHNMAQQLAARPDLDMRAYEAKWTYFHVSGQLSRGINGS